MPEPTYNVEPCMGSRGVHKGCCCRLAAGRVLGWCPGCRKHEGGPTKAPRRETQEAQERP